MASYYYLMSSLPMLKYDGEPPFKYSEFIEKCKNSVSEQVYSLLENLSFDSKNGPLVSEWAEFYGALSEELNYQRSLKLKKNASAPLFRNGDISKIVSAVLNETNPLVAEKALLSVEFSKLDSLVGTHSFDDYALMGYALKLKLLERKSVFEEKSGKKELDKILKDLEEKVKSMK